MKLQKLLKEKFAVCLCNKNDSFKKQISKLYSQILNTKVSFYIYDKPLTGMNVCVEFSDKL